MTGLHEMSERELMGEPEIMSLQDSKWMARCKTSIAPSQM